MAAASRAPVWSQAALADLSGIWSHYAKVAGRLTADKTVRDIGAACRTIEARPFAGRARDDVRPALRSIAAGPLVVFYRLDRREGTDILEILRVLDRRKDFEEMFASEGERRS
jgi:plasmid stabilization system protein ParE